jgi:hypothetical protein
MVGLVDFAAQLDLLIIDPGKGNHRGTASLHAKGGKGLNAFSLVKEGGGQDLGGDDGALAAPAVYSNFNHWQLHRLLKGTGDEILRQYAAGPAGEANNGMDGGGSGMPRAGPSEDVMQDQQKRGKSYPSFLFYG